MKLSDYIHYGIASLLHVFAVALIVMFYIAGKYVASTAIGCVVGIFWAIVLMAAYRKLKHEYNMVKDELRK